MIVREIFTTLLDARRRGKRIEGLTCEPFAWVGFLGEFARLYRKFKFY